MEKKCNRCNKTKPIDQFYKNKPMPDGRLKQCKVCSNKYYRQHYRDTIEERREYERKRWADPERRAKAMGYQRTRRARYPGKERARRKVAYEIKKGNLTRQPCEECGETRSQAHHTDYRKALDIQWLCFKHHRAKHGQVTA